MTTAIPINRILELNLSGAVGLFRILHITSTEVAAFELSLSNALPFWIPLDDLRASVNTYEVAREREAPYAARNWPDEDLTPAAVRIRDTRLAIIRPIVALDDDGRAPALYPDGRGGLIDEAVAAHGVAKDKIYIWLRLWWRLGQVDNALLPAFDRCGRGPRAQGGAKRGRPLTVGKLHPDHVGVNVDPKMRAAIVRGARRFFSAKPGEGRMSRREAYQATLEAFFFKRLELKDGVLIPILHEGPEDDNRFPTFDQWNYYVDESLKEKGRLAARFGARDMALRRRPVLGSSERLSRGPGDLYLIDATVVDLHLLSSYDRRWSIGRPILYLVIDHFSRMISGFHLAFEGPNWSGAMMALANAFTGKVELCAKHGIEIDHAAWPCDVVPSRLTADRGEVISEHADYMVPGFRLTIHDTPPFRADFKSFVEGQFKITNEKGIKRLPGWVDKLRQRGDPDHRYDATLDLEHLTKVIIQLILHNNHNRPIRSHVPLDYPLSDAGAPVPIELWDWGLDNATTSQRRFDIQDVRRNLLPTFDAITTRQGLSTMGGRLRYTLSRAIDEGWFVRAPGRGGVHHKLAIDPWDVSVAYLRGPHGLLEPCDLIPADVGRFAGRSMPDVEDFFDREKMRTAADARRQIQADADLHAKIGAIKDDAAQARRAALDESGQARPFVAASQPLRHAERDIRRIADATQAVGDPAPPIEVQVGTSKPLDDDDMDVSMPD